MEETPMLVLFAALSASIYFGAGYRVAWLFRAPVGWRIAIGVALPALTFLVCWWIDRNAEPRGIIYISMKVLWMFPGILLARLFMAH